MTRSIRILAHLRRLLLYQKVWDYFYTYMLIKLTQTMTGVTNIQPWFTLIDKYYFLLLRTSFEDKFQGVSVGFLTFPKIPKQLDIIKVTKHAGRHTYFSYGTCITNTCDDIIGPGISITRGDNFALQFSTNNIIVASQCCIAKLLSVF